MFSPSALQPLRKFEKAFLLFALGFAVFLIIPEAASAVTISPPRIEVSLDPGATHTGVYKLTNDSNFSRTYVSSFENFEAEGETGTPKFVESGDGLAGWISGPNTITIAPGESKEVPFYVNVPASAEPGGYFAAIFWGIDPGEDGQVRISAKIGTLILLRVNGEINEDGGILEFAPSIESKKFYTELPIDFYYRFQNGGTDRVLPRGTLSTKNIIGVTHYYNANSSEGNVLPGTIRRFTVTWGDPLLSDLDSRFFPTVGRQWQQFAFGPYRVDLDITYGSRGLTANERVKVFVLPWQLLVTVIVVLVGGFLLLRFIMRRYNKFIIAKAYQMTQMQQSTTKVDEPLSTSKKSQKRTIK